MTDDRRRRLQAHRLCCKFVSNLNQKEDLLPSHQAFSLFLWVIQVCDHVILRKNLFTTAHSRWSVLHIYSKKKKKKSEVPKSCLLNLNIFPSETVLNTLLLRFLKSRNELRIEATACFSPFSQTKLVPCTNDTNDMLSTAHRSVIRNLLQIVIQCKFLALSYMS